MAQGATLEVVTKDELKHLIQQQPGPALSIFHPTDRVAVGPEQNSLRLKNLLGTAHDLLEERGLRRPDIVKILEPLNSLLGNVDFWQHQLEGLALFRTPDFFRFYRLPFQPDELVVAGHRLHIKPLLGALAGERHFYILALSQGGLRLLRATLYGVDEVSLDHLDIPRSLAEALRYDDLQKPELKHHPTLAPGRSDSGPAAPSRGHGRVTRKHAFHGHGTGGEDQKNEILRFFQAVDDGLIKVLGADHAPLVIAAVDYLQPLYRAVTKYRYVLDNGVAGNPDQLSPAELHKKAVPLVEPEFRRDLESARERLGNKTGTGLTSTDVHEILRSAHQGRIDSLFICKGVQRWGSYNVETDELTRHDGSEPGDLDLLDEAATHTILGGGTAFLLDKAEMPDAIDEIVALYRF